MLVLNEGFTAINFSLLKTVKKFELIILIVKHFQSSLSACILLKNSRDNLVLVIFDRTFVLPPSEHFYGTYYGP